VSLHRAVQGEVTLHPRVAIRVLQNIRGENPDAEPLFTELTERELDVLKLIASGLTNSQIAEKLVISENTVKGHVSNILSKLHVADRTQVAVYTWQRGIVHREQGIPSTTHRRFPRAHPTFLIIDSIKR
jgi:NarL family two-component system response regulator LiaR